MGPSPSIEVSKESKIRMKDENAHRFINEIKGTHTYMKPEWANGGSIKKIIFMETKKPRMGLFNFSESRVEKGETPDKFEIIEVQCDDDTFFNMVFTKFGGNPAIDQKDVISFLREMVATYTSEKNIKVVLQPLNDISVVVPRGVQIPVPPNIYYYTTWKMILQIE
ncbi:unnamed protein product [Rotaria magnacalcarata]|uniref:Uncharacterized protein n=2 Tax=Rotaria magnacalcarata TaxID=392030 RepID=A0A816VXP0_9BILA|nr:unnamed protein product [Rotaria magnacalcarata]CAF1520659.1 unnamed protein product [Rotaria magnacalcarata]CAF2125727.1 unnamed protein product [Rotaria magnacalcarata]CAF2144921.1 unnamed protein product [Rotaria magnacalcarata]CAF2208718.1 unnamed protein product [Rotaria magnacalcarata]